MTVLIAYSPGPRGDAALQEGAAEATRRNKPLIIVNVAHGDTHVEPDIATAAQIDELRALTDTLTVPTTVIQPVDAPPVDAILCAITQHQADVLVVGIKKRNPVGKLLMGSIAQQLLLHAPCPVLAVKAATR